MMSKMTNREQDVINLILKGFLTEKEIAERLIISTTTVKTHFKNIFQKLNLHSKTELVGFLFEEKLKSMKVYIASMENKNKELMSKNEELKEYCKQIEELCKQKIVDIFEMYNHIQKIEETNKILYEEKCDLIKENEELRKQVETNDINKFFDLVECLDEIEEIVKDKCNDCTIKINDYSYCPECHYKVIKNVRKIIKEVRGEE